jgi:hypothetical protein
MHISIQRTPEALDDRRASRGRGPRALRRAGQGRRGPAQATASLPVVGILESREYPQKSASVWNSSSRPGALTALTSAMLFTERRRLVDLAAKNRLPAVYPWRESVHAGGLMSSQGAKPADVPVEQPTKFELVINMKTAEALGLTIPPSLLLRADEVIQ